MSAAKHTSGPWRVTTKSRLEIATMHGIQRRPTEDGLGQGWVYIVPDTKGFWRGADEAEQEANLRLIVSAPELYEIVKARADEAMTCETPGVARDDDADEEIAKARVLVKRIEDRE